MNKLTTLAAASTLALASQTATAESNNTSSESINANASAQIEVVKDSVCNQTKLALEMEKCGLEMPNETLTSKEVRNILLSRGINPTLIENIKIGDYQEPQLDETQFMLKHELFGDVFTTENISQKLEDIAKFMNEKVGSQYNQGDWTKSMDAMNPNEDEAEVLNDYIAALPDRVDPLTVWQGATKLLAVKRFANHPEQISDQERETMEFLLVDNMYGIIKALRPELLDGKILVLPEEYQGKSYKFLDTNYQLVSIINSLLPKEDHIKSERITDFNEVYAQILEAGKSEYIDAYLATEEAVEDEVTREDMEDEYAELLDVLAEDDAENDFPELIAQYAPKLGVDLMEILPLKGESQFAYSLELIAQSSEQMQLIAQLKTEGNRLQTEGNRLQTEGNRLQTESDKYVQIVKNYEKLGVKQD